MLAKMAGVAVLATAVGIGGHRAYSWFESIRARRATAAPASTAPALHHLTKKGSKERPIEVALMPVDFGRAKLISIRCSPKQPSHCLVKVQLPTIYWGAEELKADADSYAVTVMRAVFDGVAAVKRITFVAMGEFDVDGRLQKEPAIQVDITRTDHEKADYSVAPAQILKPFSPHYHRSIP